MFARTRLGVFTVLSGCFLLSIAVGGYCQAAPIIEPDTSDYKVIVPVSGRVRHGGETVALPPAFYNGAGLDGSNPLFANQGDDPTTFWTYPISTSEYPVSLEFDLGGNFLVTEMWLWQLQGQMSDYGVRAFDVIMKDSFGAEVGMLTTRVDDLKAAEYGPVTWLSAFGDCILLPFPDCVRFVELRIRENLGNPNWLGLAEIAFAGRQKGTLVPEPSALALAGLGFVLFLSRGRRRVV